MIFSLQEREAVGELLKLALLNDPIFSPELFHTLTGTSASEISVTFDSSKILDLNDLRMRRLVFDVLNSLVNFPHRQGERIWSEIGLTTGQMRDLAHKLRVLGV
jgi:hypothetical protein